MIIVSRIDVRTFLLCSGVMVFVFKTFCLSPCLATWVFFVLFLFRILLVISFAGCWTLWFAGWGESFLSLICNDDGLWLLLCSELLFSHIWCRIIAVYSWLLYAAHVYEPSSSPLYLPYRYAQCSPYHHLLHLYPKYTSSFAWYLSSLSIGFLIPHILHLGI